MKKELIIFTLLAVFFISCSSSISSIRENPSRYNGRVVSLSGDVTETFKIAGTGAMIYFLYDGTGTIPVFTLEKRKIGDKVNIRARVFAVVTQGAVRNVDVVIDKIIEYLKDNDIIDGKLVKFTGKVIAKVMKIVLAKSEGSYFLLER